MTAPCLKKGCFRRHKLSGQGKNRRLQEPQTAFSVLKMAFWTIEQPIKI
jgi:hypothetical protein